MVKKCAAMCDGVCSVESTEAKVTAAADDNEDLEEGELLDDDADVEDESADVADTVAPPPPPPPATVAPPVIPSLLHMKISPPRNGKPNLRLHRIASSSK